jgi:hypothetical protein
VPEQSARLRFFLCSDHTPRHIGAAVDALAEETGRLNAQSTDLAALALQLRQRHG